MDSELVQRAKPLFFACIWCHDAQERSSKITILLSKNLWGATTGTGLGSCVERHWFHSIALEPVHFNLLAGVEVKRDFRPSKIVVEGGEGRAHPPNPSGAKWPNISKVPPGLNGPDAPKRHNGVTIIETRQGQSGYAGKKG